VEQAFLIRLLQKKKYSDDSIASKHLEELKLISKQLSENALCALPYDFDVWALPHQRAPIGDWATWVILGGRGAGKTRAGSEWVRGLVEGPTPQLPGICRRVALVGDTIDQVREVMIFGDSGILACSLPDRCPKWNSTRKSLIWKNGAEALVVSAHNPEVLRGPQFDAAWLDELGFPAVDKGTNQPNVFIDPKSSESASPYYSNLEQDPQIQESGLRAVLEYWQDEGNNPISSQYNGKMVDVERTHIWAWDARPWPDFPLRTNVWSDGENYELGHWLSGRMGGDQLARIVGEICECCGVDQYDVSALNQIVNGFWIKGGTTGREALQVLMSAYEFNSIESEGVMVFKPTDTSTSAMVEISDLVDTGDDLFSISRNSDAAMIDQVSLGFWNSDQNYQFSQLEARQNDVLLPSQMRLEYPLVLRKSEASVIVQKILLQQGKSREGITFTVPISRVDLTVGDTILVEKMGLVGRYQIGNIEEHSYRIVEAVRIPPMSPIKATSGNSIAGLPHVVAPNPVYASFLNLPTLEAGDSEIAPYIAVTASPWPSGAVFYASKDDEHFEVDYVTLEPTVIGRSLTDVHKSMAHCWSEISFDVKVSSGILSSVTEKSLLAGRNLAAIKGADNEEWELFQYQYATLISDGTYRLSRLLRGQFGTDAFIPEIHTEGSEVIFLNSGLGQLKADGAEFRDERNVRYGPSKLQLSDPNFTTNTVSFKGTGLRPFRPVHMKGRVSSNGDLVLTWIRRTRAIGDFWSASEVPLNEAAEKYRVTIWVNGTQIRSIDSQQPKCTYSFVEQSVDGVVGEIEISVSQISEIYGLGPSARIIINV
jgi:hypothetical protein